jgi:Ca2+-binding EF-hand superfamily protein
LAAKLAADEEEERIRLEEEQAKKEAEEAEWEAARIAAEDSEFKTEPEAAVEEPEEAKHEEEAPVKKERVVLNKAQKKKLRDKKNKMLKNIQKQISEGEEMDEEKTTDIATKWMEVADIDESGTIDFSEFKEMIGKLDDTQSEETLKEFFDHQDSDNSGELSVENFGKALYESFKVMKQESVEEDN